MRALSRHREIVAVIDPAWAVPGTDDVTKSVRASEPVVAAAAELLAEHLHPGEVVAGTPEGRLIFRLRHDDRAARPMRLQQMAYYAIEALSAGGHSTGLIDLGIGWALITHKTGAEAAERQAVAAARESGQQRDLQPRLHGGTRRGSRVRTTWWADSTHMLLATVAAVLVPFLVLVVTYTFGIDLSGSVYWFLVAALAVTASQIWAECFHAFDPPQAPPAPERPAPRATAVIAAYLPNESDTVLETLHAFLAQEYAGGLQIVLAYNTPTPMAVERELQRLAAQHPDLTVVKVPDSTSKAQNVNAAMRVAEGEFVGIFDADHHPMPGAFDRAWQWIASGVDVVQGHCVIRNGGDSALAKLVAVEFEQIYAVAHPGRASLHGFGVFGGSNGYWSASSLAQIRLRGSFLTEDIEASMRVLGRGGRIVNDPGLISYELAPETPQALWRQRMRWAQGWFQVSVRHLGPILRSPRLSGRQKLGAAYLLGWREMYPWVSLMVLPLLMFMLWRDGGIDFSSPMFLMITLFVTVAGPLQTFAAWRLAAPEIRKHPWWFVWAAVASLLAYTEIKNLVNRVAHLKQIRGEHQWVVTPRSATTTVPDETDETGETGEANDTDGADHAAQGDHAARADHSRTRTEVAA